MFKKTFTLFLAGLLVCLLLGGCAAKMASAEALGARSWDAAAAEPDQRRHVQRFEKRDHGVRRVHPEVERRRAGGGFWVNDSLAHSTPFGARQARSQFPRRSGASGPAAVDVVVLRGERGQCAAAPVTALPVRRDRRTGWREWRAGWLPRPSPTSGALPAFQ